MNSVKEKSRKSCFWQTLGEAVVLIIYGGRALTQRPLDIQIVKA